jgi:serine/threonine protein kinase
MLEMVTCVNCQQEAAPGSKVCASCGTRTPLLRAGQAEYYRLGETIKGTYAVEARIGSGAMGDVYRARHIALDMAVALKVLKHSLLADPAIVERFQREAWAISRLRHPNIIQVSDFGQAESGSLYMAMEFIAGRNLGQAIADDGPFSEERVVHIGEQILSALSEAHANQILHRDLKPANVMLESRRTDPDVVKVVDFGIAKIQSPGDRSMNLTDPGLVCGTPAYMSPEQWDSEPLDARSDLYSVGVILYKMLTGKVPFEVRSPMEMMRKQLARAIVPPATYREGGLISEDLQRLVMRSLSFEKESRPQSAEAMRAELLSCKLLESSPRLNPKSKAISPGTIEMSGSGGDTLNLRPGSAEKRQKTDLLPNSGRPIHEGSTSVFRKGTSIDVELESLPIRTGRKATAVVALAVFSALVLAGGALWGINSRKKIAPVEATPHAEKRRELVILEDKVEALQAEPGATQVSMGPVGLSLSEDPVAKTEIEAEDKSAQSDDNGPRPRKKRRRAPVAFESQPKLYSMKLPTVDTGYGILALNSDPPGGTAFVNGVPYGVAPREVLVPAGTYRIRIAHSKFGQESHELFVRAGTRSLWTAALKEQ